MANGHLIARDQNALADAPPFPPPIRHIVNLTREIFVQGFIYVWQIGYDASSQLPRDAFSGISMLMLLKTDQAGPAGLLLSPRTPLAFAPPHLWDRHRDGPPDDRVHICKWNPRRGSCGQDVT